MTIPTTRNLEAAFELCRIPPANLKIGQMKKLLFHLGTLTRWWLHDEVRQRLHSELEQGVPLGLAPGSAGSCWIVYVLDKPSVYPGLREGFILPLQWREGRNHDARLPEAIRTMAEEIRRELHRPKWSLHPHSSLDEAIDLGAMERFDPSSGWASLAGGLLVAEQGRPDPRTFASGCWEWQEGILRVDDKSLPTKLQVARDMRAERFFVPTHQEQSAKQIAPDLDIGTLREGTTEPLMALRDYAMRMEVEPPPPTNDKEFKDCCDWHWRHRFELRANDFYERCVLPTIINNCREGLRKKYPKWKPPENLVTIVSSNRPFMVLMLARTLGVKHCLLLHTKEPEQIKKMEWAKARLEGEDLSESERISTESWDFDNDENTICDRLRQGVADYRRRRAKQPLLFDITSGNSLMKHYLPQTTESHDWMICVMNDSKEGQWVAGKEYMVPLQL